ncbi:MAG: YceI family protein [Vicingaceae bacterium]|nr:hypothetical protein [Flavobacteriales bacterium]MDF1675266.1 YceI family protein [Vicingaceae bacterium]|tara:strand:- start:92 stop:739 length:648 start_codon:yes stop_codon:yes gene_type:complete
MKKIIFPTVIITSLFLISCGDNNKDKNNTIDSSEPICFYEYTKTSSATVSWTAFKTTEKVGVGGTFNQVMVKGGEKSTKITDVLSGINFTIMTESTFTKDESRDKKIIESFFGAMDATDLIIGQVKSAKGNNENGTCTFYLTLNNIEKEVILDYTVNDNKVSLTGEIDLINWNGDNAIASLNKVCEDLHKGEDGVSKLWSVVQLNIEASLDKNCN